MGVHNCVQTDSPFTTLEFVTSSLGRPLDGYSLDNVAFSPIPIPGALWLFGSGLLGLIALSRTKEPKGSIRGSSSFGIAFSLIHPGCSGRTEHH